METPILDIANVVEPRIQAIVRETEVEIETANSLKLAFGPFFQSADAWVERAKAINVTDASQEREMKLARETRLALREIRVGAEKTRVRLKADSLRKGKAIDGIANVLKFLIEPVEEELLAMEEFAARQESERKAKLHADREAELKALDIDTAAYKLGEMSDAAYGDLLERCREIHAKRAEDARLLEEARIKREEAEESERLRIENEKLRTEAQEREAALRAERRKAEEERQARVAAERKARDEQTAREAVQTQQRAVESRLREVEAKPAPSTDWIDACAQDIHDTAKAVFELTGGLLVTEQIALKISGHLKAAHDGGAAKSDWEPPHPSEGEESLPFADAPHDPFAEEA